MKYIKGCFGTSGNEDKEKKAASDYDDERKTMSASMTTEEFSDLANTLQNKRDALVGTPREVSDARFCSDLKDMVSNLSFEHEQSVKFAFRELDPADRAMPAVVGLHS